jgi:hypothetical protein
VSKIKSRPIQILIDEVIMELEEPSVVLPPRHGVQPPGPPGPLDAPHRYALGMNYMLVLRLQTVR